MSVRPCIDPVHVALACDENYVMPLAAMLASLVARLDSRHKLVVHVLGTDLSRDAWCKLRASVPAKNVHWDCIELQSSLLIAQGFDSRSYEHISATSFFRLLLPELLSGELEKVLYLDCDMVVCADITNLWCTDIRDVPFAAVTEWDRKACLASSPAGIRRYRELGMPEMQPLFNAGVLLVNLQYWRRTSLAHRAFAYLREIGADVRWYEQEALNVVTNGEYLELDRRWNVPADSVEQLADGGASIVHFLSARKPWHWYYNSAQAASFFAALDRTAWSGWRPTRPRLGAVTRRATQLAKAVIKRLSALQRIVSNLGPRLHYLRAMPMRRRFGTAGKPPAGSGCEVRLFLTAPSVDDELIQTLITAFDAGVERAFVLVGRTAEETSVIPSQYASLVHLFACNARAVVHAQRKLLHRYGSSHWCVLGRPGEEIVAADASTTNLRECCEQLDAEGIEAQEGANGDVDQIELTARDARTNRIFRGTAGISKPACSYDSPVFETRVVLLKYSDHILLDADAILCGNVRKSPRRLRFRPLAR